LFESLTISADDEFSQEIKDPENNMRSLTESGEKDRLKEYIRNRLIESGWYEDLKEQCKDIIRKKGVDHITVDELVSEITPYGRASVPSEIKAETLAKIKKLMQPNS